jgi:beta-lactamase regulating signal transducer with metallopeptidase domain
MNQFAPVLILCVTQVTVLTLVAAAVHLVLRRRSPAVRSSVALSALVMIIGVSLLAFSPWPNWTRSLWDTASTPESSAALATAGAESTESTAAIESAAGTRLATLETESVWTAAWNGFRASVTAPTTEAVAPIKRPSISTFAVVGMILGLGIAIGLVRLIGGWLAVAKLKRSSRRIDDAALREQVEILQAELSCSSAIELCESRRLATAATVGWRQPMILLPDGWREWTATELRAVLAHELAHIHHRDYAAWLVAQLGVVLHFYHPLVHWLAGRLRIDQELAADAAAAPLAGGRQTYLETLASLALRHSDRRLSWPVRAFLPTRQTFLRRLEMLRDPRQLSTRSPGRARWLSFAVMGLAGLAIAGLRGPGQQTFAQSPAVSIVAGQSSATSGGQLSLAYVPRDAAVVIAMRPSKLLSTDALKPVLQALTADPESVKQFGISPDQVEELSVVYLLGGDQGGNPIRAIEPGLVIRCRADGQAKQFAEALNKGATPRKFDGKEVFVGDGRGAHHLADGRTLVYAPSEPALRRLLIAGPASKGPTALQQPWTKVSGNDVAVAVNVAALNPLMHGGALEPALAPFAPLWERTESAIFGLNLGADFQLHGLVLCGSEDDAKRVRDTINAAIVLARNGLSALRDSAARIPAEESAVKLRVADVADELLEKIVTEQAGDSVTLAAKGDVSQAGNLVTSLLPAVANARMAARRAQDMNNMRQIMLALHNYHDTFGHFPPAVIKSKDGKPLYSWRVALLPYLDQAPLWNQFNPNEPWDSAHNKKVLEKVPAVFHSPLDPADLNTSSYFVFTGAKTAFGNPDGTNFSEIHDGTSNTIAIVEAKRDIHWASPEDIPFDPEKPLPEVGGRYAEGFLAGVCDGSVKLFPRTIDAESLKLLIMKDDGRPIDYNRFQQ